MKHITVVIPTRRRLKKVLRVLSTIPATGIQPMNWLSVRVICDGDLDCYVELRKRYGGNEQVAITLVEKHSGAVFCRNHSIPTVRDGLLYATDDIIFRPGTFEQALKIFNLHFPDDDGVLGFRQEGTGGNFHPTGVALMGSRFLDRYPGRMPFFTGYYHFSAQEVHWLAAKLERFAALEEPPIFHYHPAFYREEKDKTHREARKRRSEDRMLKNKRKEMGLIWGWDYDKDGPTEDYQSDSSKDNRPYFQT